MNKIFLKFFNKNLIMGSSESKKKFTFESINAKYVPTLVDLVDRVTYKIKLIF